MHFPSLHPNSYSQYHPNGLSVWVCIVALVGLMISLPGCGEKGQRIMKLASYEPVTVESHGSRYAHLYVAYYNTKSKYRPVDEGQSNSSSARELRAFIEALSPTDNEAAALGELLRIESHDLGQSIRRDVVVNSMPPIDIWNELQPIAKMVFVDTYFDNL